MRWFLKVVAFYLDYFTALAVINFGFHLAGGPSDFQTRAVLSLIVAAALAITGASLGRLLLSEIVRLVSDPPWTRRVLINLWLGVAAYVQGTRELFSAPVTAPSMSVMGIALEGEGAIALDIAFTAAVLAMGVLLLRLNRFGRWIGLTLMVLSVVSISVDWLLYPAEINDILAAEFPPGFIGNGDEIPSWLPAVMLANFVGKALVLLFCVATPNGARQSA